MRPEGPRVPGGDLNACLNACEGVEEWFSLPTHLGSPTTRAHT